MGTYTALLFNLMHFSIYILLGQRCQRAHSFHQVETSIHRVTFRSIFSTFQKKTISCIYDITYLSGYRKWMLLASDRLNSDVELSWVELNLLFNVTINDISVIYVTAHRCAGGLKKKLDLRSGSQRHRHFAGFFNVPVLAPTRDHPFYTVIPTHRPI